MIFTQAQVDRLLAGETVVLTVPKKEGDGSTHFGIYFGKRWYGNVVKFDTKRVKFQVGRDYAVMLGGKSVWHCSKCNKIYEGMSKENYEDYGPPTCRCVGYEQFTEPLRFVVKSIRAKNSNWVLEVKK